MSFTRNLSNKYGKQLLDAATKTGLNALKTMTKKVAHKVAGATEEFIGNRSPNKIVKPIPMSDENSRNAEEMIISSEKKRRNT